MPRRLVPLIAGHYYHAYNRGIESREIFAEKFDYQHFLETFTYYTFSNYPTSFSKFLKRFSAPERTECLKKLREEGEKTVDVICFCLMPNHFHFILRQAQDGGISKFMANVQSSYSHFFNTKYERIGHLFQGAFKSLRIEFEEYLLHLSRYIHLNPYSASLVGNFEELLVYPWSSLPQYIGDLGAETPLNPIGLCPDVVLSNFSGRRSYEKFLRDRADYQKELETIKHLIFGAKSDPGSALGRSGI